MNLDTLGKRLAIEEGDRLVAYPDSKGILTVGRGHNCVVRPVAGVTKAGDRITPEQDQQLFQADVQDACAQLDSRMPWWRGLDDDRQNVMLDLCFNMGIDTLASFHNTLKAIVEERWDDAATLLSKSLWDKQVGHRADFLEDAMRTGVYA